MRAFKTVSTATRGSSYTVRSLPLPLFLYSFDDVLDVFPVHGVGGMAGAILTGVFAAESMGGSGLAADGGMLAQALLQAFGVGVTLAWSGGVSFVLLKLLDRWLGIRVSADEETEGLDIAQHDSKGYNL